MAVVRVLSTKKLQPNQKQYLLNAGLAVLEANFIGIEYRQFRLNNTAPNLIFTSKNAFAGFLLNKESGTLKHSAIFCVGNKTKESIKRAGYRVLAFADNAEGLADIIIKNYRGESFTFFSGNMRRDTLPDALANANIPCNEVEVYKTVLTPQPIPARLNGILFFSPSGIESYLQANTITTETCFCIGATTAAALTGSTTNVVVANKPSVENVIIQVRNYYRDSN